MNAVAAPHLLDVTLQHCEQFAQLPLAFGGVVRAFDAVMYMRVDQFFRERFQPAPGGDDLREDFRAVAIFVQHPLDGTELAGDFAHADDGGAAFLLGMLMTVFLVHAGRLRASGSFVKNALANMGYGGMLLTL